MSGNITTDELCLDPMNRNCLTDFDFVYAKDFKQDKIKGVQMDGVIPFNRYSMERD